MSIHTYAYSSASRAGSIPPPKRIGRNEFLDENGKGGAGASKGATLTPRPLPGSWPKATISLTRWGDRLEENLWAQLALSPTRIGTFYRGYAAMPWPIKRSARLIPGELR
jgi:hypothetical protein